ncbi:MAG: alpha/beta hydrolase fold domain-containing protein [Acidobacteria bacterium]|nr:alpha/beta hydrolase fold domain-containing protein [Acidobacteriota bacterium]
MGYFWKGVFVVFGIVVMLAIQASSTESRAPTPPSQPSTGPGGSTYAHAAVRKTLKGEGALQFWVFEPAEPRPEAAPLVVFNHGWGATNPRAYGAWIEHIVRRGNIVVYPVYQKPGTWRYPTHLITPNAIKATKDAIAYLRESGHVRPQLEKFAIAGHSAGGQVAANMVAQAAGSGLPEPKAVMSVQPGNSWKRPQIVSIPLADMTRIPASTLILAAVGDRDDMARDIDAKRIIAESTRVPEANKDYVIVVSDEHGTPALEADHFSPVAMDPGYGTEQLAEGAGEIAVPDFFSALKTNGRTVNGLDFYGYWKLFDGLCAAAFGGPEGRKYFGGTPEQKYMGKWSDGVPVKELIVRGANQVVAEQPAPGR